MLNDERLSADKVHVNEATIVESEVFVYNLGTMFYIDQILFTDKETLPAPTSGAQLTTPAPAPSPTNKPTATAAAEEAETTTGAVEAIPEELTEEGGSMPDVLFADAEAITTENGTHLHHHEDFKSLSQNATVK